jgi:hypothetical protein
MIIAGARAGPSSVSSDAYELRRHLRRMCDALAAQPPEVQGAVRRALPPRTGPEIPHD